MGNIYFFMVVSAFLLCGYAININAEDSHHKVRLLTPDEGCGISKVANTKIVGGVPAKNGAYPWMALLGYPKGFSFTPFDCGGTLITSRHVLTAAHCLAPDLSFVRLGEYDLFTLNDGAHDDIKIVRAEKHPKFDKMEFTYDLAILTLERDVEFNDRIRPICLPLTQELQNKSFIGSNPFVAGWGKVEEDGWPSNVLMQAQIPIITNSRCEQLYKKKLKRISSSELSEIALCAGHLAGGQDSCEGDSGGPLMLPIQVNGTFPMHQIGIVSWGAGCGRANKPGVYTRVSHFIDWIQKEIDLTL